MRGLIDRAGRRGSASEDDWFRLRRGLLLVEREKTRLQGQRLLEKLAQLRDLELSSVAEAGLSSSYFWANDYRQSLFWARHAIKSYPMSTASVWCSSLLITLFRQLGMRRERFEAERERIRIMKKIAFNGASRDDRIFVLNELLRELDSRDQPEDARRYAEELEDLLAVKGPRSTIRKTQEDLDTFDINSRR